MKKKLLLLCLSAFAVVSANAWTVSDGVLTINGTSEMNSIQSKPAGTYTTIKLVGDFTGGWESGTWFNNGDASTKTGITTLDMSEADMTVTSSWKCTNFTDLKNITWPTAGNITNIPSFAFKDCGMEELRIPGYIQTIENTAFVETSNARALKKIYFDKWEGNDTNVNMHIGFQAFSNNYGLTDVYILTEGTITAENNAFPHWDTYGHADPNRVTTALHYPESKVELYANLDHVLTEEVASDSKKFQEWLVAHYTKAGEAENGFFEFVQSGADPDVAEDSFGATFLRTFSFVSTKTFTEENTFIAYIVPPGVKAYIVNSIESDAATKKVTATLKRVNVIPSGTGVILFGGSNGPNNTLRMTMVKYQGQPFDVNNTTNRNYLTATADLRPGKGTLVKPYYVGTENKVYRDFVFGPFSATRSGAKYFKEHGNYGNGNYTLAATGKQGDWAGFFRVLPPGVEDDGFVKQGLAFLSLDEDVYSQVDGGEIIIDVAAQTDPNNTGNEGEWYRLEFKDQNMTPFTDAELQAAGYWYKNDQWITWESKWGTRAVASDYTFAKYTFELEDEEWMASLGDATAISNVETNETKSSDVYNLQGMKVAQPQKGIYIKNGKKFIVK